MERTTIFLPLLISAVGLCMGVRNKSHRWNQTREVHFLRSALQVVKSSDLLALDMYSKNIAEKIPHCIASHFLEEKFPVVRRTLRIYDKKQQETLKNLETNITITVRNITRPYLQINSSDGALPEFWDEPQYISYAKVNNCIILTHPRLNGHSSKPPCTLWVLEQGDINHCEKIFSKGCQEGMPVEESECEEIHEEETTINSKLSGKSC
uniref:Putative secreted protein 94 n=1 Tax=Amblyomma triste TaxID=251400 RepID=A0A023G4A8_AMBTT